MKFLALLIKREILSIAIAFLLVVLGLFSLGQIPIRLFPKITLPVISVNTTYPGANATIVKGFITARLENTMTGIPGIDYITGSTEKGRSEIRLHLLPGTNLNTAMLRVMEKANDAKAYFPANVKGPSVHERSNDNSPVMIIAFMSHQMPRVQMAEYLRRVVEPEMEVINGVSSAAVMGPKYAMRLQLNPERLSAHNLTATDVLSALRQQNVLSQTGSLEGAKTDLSIQASSHFAKPGAFDQVPIKNVNGHIVRLKDIGTATFMAEDHKINAYFNGQPSVMLFIKPIPGANPLTIAKSVKSKLAKITSHLPYDMKAHVALNVANYIHASIQEVVRSIAIAFVIILLVLLVFLGSLRVLFIPLITIPVSLIGSLFLLRIMGYSINTLTLLAMVLAIGLVVDDAIVVVENIFRHLHTTKNKFQAALLGTKEVYGAVIAMTLTLAAVFAPIFFIGGVVGKLFAEFAFALASSVLISGLIALSLTPMMCSKILSESIEHTRLANFSQGMMSRLEHIYQISLDFVFKQRKIAMAVWLISIVGCVWLYQSTPHELAPKEDQGYLLAISDAPTMANQNYILAYRKQMEQAVTSVPGVKDYLLLQGIPGLNQAFTFPILKPWDQRKLTAMQIQPKLQQRLNRIPGIKTRVMVPNSLPGDNNAEFRWVIMSDAGYQQLSLAAAKFKAAAMKSGIFSYLSDDLKYHQPVLQLEINRDAMSAMHVTMQSVSNALALFTGNLESQQFNYFGQSYDVVLSANKAFRQSPTQLSLIKVRNTQGDLVPLMSLMDYHVAVKASSLNDFQKQSSVTLSGVLAPGHSLSQAITYANHAAKTLLPDNMRYSYSGTTRQYLQEGSRFLQVFCLSLIIICLILGIQFNSFKDALLIILGSVPMTLFAALIPLKFGLGTINIYTQIALLTLVGLIAKHGVLMTKFANQLKEQGLDKHAAIKKAAIVRFRPILMTTIAMSFGALPLVIMKGAGSVSRFQLGLTIIVGLLLGTLCTLFVLPVLYQLYKRD
jgi:multidrug efflux pump